MTLITQRIPDPLLTKVDAYAKKEYGGNRTLTINKILEKWLKQHEV